MKTFIIDSSVAAKWFFPEEEQDASLIFYQKIKKKEIRAIVPDLFYLEMSSICWKRLRKQMINYDSASAVIEKIAEVSFECYSDKELADIAFENAARFGISVYDAVYVALAEVYAAPLVTADKKLAAALNNRFDFILPLQEFKS